MEFAILVPWYVFLFAGALDMGIYSYALISVEGAARVAALYTSASSGTQTNLTNACPLVLGQLHGLPNIPTSISSCSVAPVTVTLSAVTGPDGKNAAQVTVVYVAPTLSGIPGLIPANYTVTRTVKMRLRTGA